MKKSQFPVCACDQMPGLHHPGNCDGNEPTIFTEEEIDQQKQCEHEDMFDGVCATCGFVDQTAYNEAEAMIGRNSLTK